MGGALVAALREALPRAELIAIGTNTTATAAMLKAGAHAGATGENPVVVAARDADVIVGPMGIVLANALMGEVTPKMARAVGESRAKKYLLPVSRCGCVVAGVQDLPLAEYVRQTVQMIGESGETL